MAAEQEESFEYKTIPFPERVIIFIYFLSTNPSAIF